MTLLRLYFHATFYFLIFRMETFNQDEWNDEISKRKFVCVCACVVKLSRMRTINFVPLTTHPQQFYYFLSYMNSKAYTNTRPENSSWRLWCWWDPWSFKKNYIYTKKAPKTAAVTKIFCCFSLLLFSAYIVYIKIFRKLIFYSLFLDVCVNIITMWM